MISDSLNLASGLPPHVLGSAAHCARRVNGTAGGIIHALELCAECIVEIHLAALSLPPVVSYVAKIGTTMPTPCSVSGRFSFSSFDNERTCRPCSFPGAGCVRNT